MPSLTFGSSAPRFPDQALPLLAVAPSDARAALIEAVRMRRRGLRFLVFPMIDDQRAGAAIGLAHGILNESADVDAVREAFDALGAGTLSINGIPVHQYASDDPAAVETLGIVCRLAEGVVARSLQEGERFERTFLYHFEHIVYALPESDAPIIQSQEHAREIVVWAPRHRPELLAHVFAAAQEVRHPISVVCAEPFAHDRIRFVPASEGAAALARARLIVDTSLSGPEDAMVLANGAAALAVASTSGATEYLDDALVYDPWDRRTLAAALHNGIGAAPASVRQRVPPPSAQFDSEVATGPLVTLIVRTRNRPVLLRRALASAAAQSYANIEIIVVNDGGVNVADVVAEFSGVRLIEHDQQRGANAAANSGVAAAKGVYVGLLDDDDELLPNHFATLVPVLERAGADVAHSSGLTMYLHGENDRYEVTGFKLFLDRPVFATDLYHTCSAIPLVVLMRRSALLRAGGFPEDLVTMGDWDTYMRLAVQSHFLRVPRITALYSVRDDKSNLTADRDQHFTESFNAIRQRNSVVHRPVIHRMQLEMLAQREIQRGPLWPQPAQNIEPLALEAL